MFRNIEARLCNNGFSAQMDGSDWRFVHPRGCDKLSCYSLDAKYE